MAQEAEAAKEEAEQRFWLPLERSKGRQMGQLCVSLLFTKVNCFVCCHRAWQGFLAISVIDWPVLLL